MLLYISPEEKIMQRRVKITSEAAQELTHAHTQKHTHIHVSKEQLHAGLVHEDKCRAFFRSRLTDFLSH